MSRAPAFTLTELLVVLTILGLLVGIVSISAPQMFARAALRDAESRLRADLDIFATRARQAGAFGAFEANSDGRSYHVLIDQHGAIVRQLPRQVRVRVTAARLNMDPAGRLEPGLIILETDNVKTEIAIDPFTGRALRPSDGAGGSSRRKRHHRSRTRHVHERDAQFALRPRPRPRQFSRDHNRRACVAKCGSGLAVWASLGRTRQVFLDTIMRALSWRPQSASRTDRVHHHRDHSRRRRRHAAHFGGSPTPWSLPALTLIEMLVSLTILGLVAGLAFSNVGAWLGDSRRAGGEAEFWRSVPPAQLMLAELAAGAVQGPNAPSIRTDEARFHAYVPRLSARSQIVTLHIARVDRHSALVLEAGDVHATLLADAPPLRFAPTPAGDADAIVVEALVQGAWMPLLAAPFGSNGPLTCEFDLISRTCR
jgi:prepilin-type N-terminal cleavage/methylation domain-containing protein